MSATNNATQSTVAINKIPGSCFFSHRLLMLWFNDQLVRRASLDSRVESYRRVVTLNKKRLLNLRKETD